MRLVFLEGDMSRSGGTERMTAMLTNALSQNHVVSILELHGDGSSFFPLESSVKCLPLPKKHPRKAIRRFLQKNCVDFVVNVDTGMALFGIPASIGIKTKVITWEHSNYYNNWGSKWFPYIRRFAAWFSDAVVVLTERDKQNYEGNIVRCCQIITIGNPVESPKANYSIESKTILSAGHLSVIKRFDLIPEIGKLVFDRHPDWQWYICGEGPERQLLEEKISQYGLEKNIVLTGSLKDMEKIYQSASMYVMTSEMEGLPMVLLEAKSYGLPIVSFDIMTGPSEIVRDSINGYLVESGDIAAMAGRICELIEQPLLREQFSDAAALDMDKFEKEGIIAQWEKLFLELRK